MDIDLRDRLDASFGEGPEHSPLDNRIAAGRRALRNRRLTLAAGAVAAVTVVTIGAVALQDGSSSHRGDKPPVVGTPSQNVDPTVLPVDNTWRAACGHAGQETCEALLTTIPPVTLLDDRSPARVTKDVQVFQRADNPLPGARSVALETQFQGLTRWWLVIRRANGTVVAEEMNPSLSSVGFDEWVTGLGDPGRKPGERITLPPS